LWTKKRRWPVEGEIQGRRWGPGFVGIYRRRPNGVRDAETWRPGYPIRHIGRQLRIPNPPRHYPPYPTTASFPSRPSTFHSSLAFIITPTLSLSVHRPSSAFLASISSVSQVVILMLSGLHHAPFYFRGISLVRPHIHSPISTPNCRFKVHFNCL